MDAKTILQTWNDWPPANKLEFAKQSVERVGYKQVEKYINQLTWQKDTVCDAFSLKKKSFKRPLETHELVNIYHEINLWTALKIHYEIFVLSAN